MARRGAGFGLSAPKHGWPADAGYGVDTVSGLTPRQWAMSAELAHAASACIHARKAPPMNLTWIEDFPALAGLPAAA